MIQADKNVNYVAHGQVDTRRPKLYSGASRPQLRRRDGAADGAPAALDGRLALDVQHALGAPGAQCCYGAGGRARGLHFRLRLRLVGAGLVSALSRRLPLLCGEWVRGGRRRNLRGGIHLHLRLLFGRSDNGVLGGELGGSGCRLDRLVSAVLACARRRLCLRRLVSLSPGLHLGGLDDLGERLRRLGRRRSLDHLLDSDGGRNLSLWLLLSHVRGVNRGLLLGSLRGVDNLRSVILGFYRFLGSGCGHL
mmetsp:Transcript_113336/g.156596  ORF Transcript_113336/g.156596 Transcript_113336/m.156596 type:complete len:250 (+) Transcript_113336:120-869(+)